MELKGISVRDVILRLPQRGPALIEGMKAKADQGALILCKSKENDPSYALALVRNVREVHEGVLVDLYFPNTILSRRYKEGLHPSGRDDLSKVSPEGVVKEHYLRAIRKPRPAPPPGA
jgi:hypothetical protein